MRALPQNCPASRDRLATAARHPSAPECRCERVFPPVWVGPDTAIRGLPDSGRLAILAVHFFDGGQGSHVRMTANLAASRSGFDARSSCPTTRVPLLPDRGETRRQLRPGLLPPRRGVLLGRPWAQRPPWQTTSAPYDPCLAGGTPGSLPRAVQRRRYRPRQRNTKPLSISSRPAIRGSDGTCEERFASLTGARAGPWVRRASRVSSYIRLGSPSRRLPLGRGAVKDGSATFSVDTGMGNLILPGRPLLAEVADRAASTPRASGAAQEGQTGPGERDVPLRSAAGSPDGWALRGVPMIGLGLPSGAIPGTEPEAALLASERRRERVPIAVCSDRHRPVRTRSYRPAPRKLARRLTPQCLKSSRGSATTRST